MKEREEVVEPRRRRLLAVVIAGVQREEAGRLSEKLWVAVGKVGRSMRMKGFVLSGDEK